MKTERAILVGFLGNYLINTILAAAVSLIPTGGASGLFTPQYIVFVVLAAILTAILTWWYMAQASRGLVEGAIFGVIGFLVAIVTVFITGIAGVMAQTGSLSSIASIVPNFWPFLWNPTTLILLCYWVIPALLVGWWLPRRGTPAQKPSIGATGGMGM